MVAEVAGIAPPHPAMPLTYPGDVWRCPITRWPVAKTREGNKKQRLFIYEQLRTGKLKQSTIVRACAASPLLWINLFGMTYRVHEVCADGKTRPTEENEVPMVTWPAQDHGFNTLFRCMRRGEDCLMDKSRDQGATWMCLFAIGWHWLFTPGFTATMLSRKEEEVDAPEFVSGLKGRPKTLFWKLRYLLDRQPPFLRPVSQSGNMSLTNKSNNAVVQGESTNLNATRGDRLNVALLDECSVYNDLGAIERATHRAAACRIFNATPVGPGHYSTLRFSGKCQVVVLGWWNHPEQGRGRHVIMEDGKPRWHGPYREVELHNTNRRAVAQNLDIDHEQSGALYFDQQVLAYQKDRYASVPPRSVGLIVPEITGDDLDEALRACNRTNARRWKFRVAPGGPLRVWCDLVWDPIAGSWHPPRNSQYYMGIDIAQGVGASNSSIAVFARETGEQVAEWTSSTVSPEKLARVACMLGWWFAGGGSTCAFMAWEQNGWGESFAPCVVDLEYPWLYKRTSHEKERPVIGDKLGWWNNDRTNKHCLGQLATALALGKMIVRSPEALEEAGRYIFTDTGTVEPAGLEEEGAKARANHGDRWRAIAIACEASFQVDKVAPPARLEVPGTVAWQLQQLQQEQEERDGRKSEYSY